MLQEKSMPKVNHLRYRWEKDMGINTQVPRKLIGHITSIQGYAELLYDGGVDQLSTQQQEILEIIIRNSERLFAELREVDITARGELYWLRQRVAQLEQANSKLPKLTTLE